MKFILKLYGLMLCRMHSLRVFRIASPLHNHFGHIFGIPSMAPIQIYICSFPFKEQLAQKSQNHCPADTLPAKSAGVGYPVESPGSEYHP